MLKHILTGFTLFCIINAGKCALAEYRKYKLKRHPSNQMICLFASPFTDKFVRVGCWNRFGVSFTKKKEEDVHHAPHMRSSVKLLSSGERTKHVWWIKEQEKLRVWAREKKWHNAEDELKIACCCFQKNLNPPYFSFFFKKLFVMMQLKLRQISPTTTILTATVTALRFTRRRRWRLRSVNRTGTRSSHLSAFPSCIIRELTVTRRHRRPTATSHILHLSSAQFATITCIREVKCSRIKGSTLKRRLSLCWKRASWLVDTMVAARQWRRNRAIYNAMQTNSCAAKAVTA